MRRLVVLFSLTKPRLNRAVVVGRGFSRDISTQPRLGL